MPDKMENLVLEHLRAIRADVGAIKEDVREIKHRLTSLEGAVAGLRRDFPISRLEVEALAGPGH
jgi:hypothetical protein